MKLVELAKKATELLKESGEKGINNIELSEKLQMSRRRVYDIVAILRAAGLIEAKREKGGTRIFWSTIPSIESPTTPAADDKEIANLKTKNKKLEDEIGDLKEKIKRLQKDSTKAGPSKTSKQMMFESSGIIIRAGPNLKITEVVSSGIEVSIKASGKGIVVEPTSEDSK